MGVVVLLLGGYETYLRGIGIVPSVSSREAVWVVSRFRVRDTSTVVVGSSRMLALVDPAIWAREYGGNPAIQLGSLGGASIPALEHLAATPTFRGLVLADVMPFFGFDKRWLPKALVEELAAFRRAQVSPASRIEAYLRVYVPYQFVFRRPPVRPRRLLEAIVARRSILNSAAVSLPNGYGPLQFRRVRTEANTARLMSPASFASPNRAVPSAAEFVPMRERLLRSVATIEGRGGTVVLIYTPGCGGKRVVEEELYPKAQFWTPIADRVAIAIDLDDYPGFDRLPCYDGSHLDVDDAAQVTAWLAGRVRAAIPARRPTGSR